MRIRHKKKRLASGPGLGEKFPCECLIFGRIPTDPHSGSQRRFSTHEIHAELAGRFEVFFFAQDSIPISGRSQLFAQGRDIEPNGIESLASVPECMAACQE
jgi:hypothetical protein